jgi:hypothetical protein
MKTSFGRRVEFEQLPRTWFQGTRDSGSMFMFNCEIGDVRVSVIYDFQVYDGITNMRDDTGEVSGDIENKTY